MRRKHLFSEWLMSSTFGPLQTYHFLSTGDALKGSENPGAGAGGGGRGRGKGVENSQEAAVTTTGPLLLSNTKVDKLLLDGA